MCLDPEGYNYGASRPYDVSAVGNLICQTPEFNVFGAKSSMHLVV